MVLSTRASRSPVLVTRCGELLRNSIESCTRSLCAIPSSARLTSPVQPTGLGLAYAPDCSRRMAALCHARLGWAATTFGAADCA